MTMLPDWFNNIVWPILMAAILASLTVTCIVLCLWALHEYKEAKQK